MRIIQTPARIFTTGGVEHYVLSLSKALADRGHDLEIVAADTQGPRIIPSNIKVIPVLSIGKIANTNITPSLPIHLLRADADIIHTHLPTPWSADLSSITARMKNIPLVLNYYNDISGKGIHSYIASSYNRTFLKTLLAHAAVIIVNRPHFLSPLLSGYKDKTRIIPPGVDIKHFHPDSKPQEWDLFFLSILDRYHYYKGLDTLLSAINLVKKWCPGFKVLIGGTGELLSHYKQMAINLGIHKNVQFIGYIPHDVLQDYYSRSRMFVLPSSDPTLEGFGMVTLEAMACGRPVITTNVSGISHEIEYHRAGIIVDPGNPEGLAEAIFEILGDKKTAYQMGKAGRDLVSWRYSWEQIACEIEDLYTDIIE